MLQVVQLDCLLLSVGGLPFLQVGPGLSPKKGMGHYIGPSLAYTPTNKGVTMYYPLRRTGFFQVCGKQFNVKTPFFYPRTY